MFYEAVAEDNTRSISVAVSKDGLTGWKCLGSPVLSADDTSGWDCGSVGAPCAVSMEGTDTDACDLTPELEFLHIALIVSE